MWIKLEFDSGEGWGVLVQKFKWMMNISRYIVEDCVKSKWNIRVTREEK